MVGLTDIPAGTRPAEAAHLPVTDVARASACTAEDRDLSKHRLARQHKSIWVCLLGWAAYLVPHVSAGRTFFVLNDLSMCSVCVLLLLMARGAGAALSRTLTRVMLVTCAVGLATAALHSGQVESVSTWFLCTLPLGAAYAVGLADAVYFAVLSTLLTLFLDTSPMWYPQPSYQHFPAETTTSHIVLLFVLFAAGYMYRRDEEAALTALSERNALIQAQMDEVVRQAAELTVRRDQALAAVRARSEFLANMSHEIRTPLSGLVGIASLLPQVGNVRDQHEWFAIMERSVSQLLEVVNGILDFSKLEASPLDLEQIPFDVVEVARAAVDLHSVVAWSKHLDLTCETSEQAWWVVGDPVRIHQILSNLISNALKFTDQGSVQVTLRMTHDAVHATVEDTGIGLGAEDTRHLFEPFTQADTSTTRLYGGTGLGLAICNKIVVALGGHIEGGSRGGGGAVFEVRLPLPPCQPLPPPPLSCTIGLWRRVAHGAPCSWPPTCQLHGSSRPSCGGSGGR